MSVILNIDTAVQTASVCLCENETIFGVKINSSPTDHAAWMHVAINELLNENGISLPQINAVAISAGPGSYTGLRVGMAAAKGLCYALKIPLITINTLQMMAFAAKDEANGLLCPMIDARRKEVFTAVFDETLKEIIPATNLILDETSFQDILSQSKITFFGNGSSKFQMIIKHTNAEFIDNEANAKDLASLAFEKFKLCDFASLAYSVPFYGKDFHSNLKQD